MNKKKNNIIIYFLLFITLMTIFLCLVDLVRSIGYVKTEGVVTSSVCREERDDEGYRYYLCDITVEFDDYKNKTQSVSKTKYHYSKELLKGDKIDLYYDKDDYNHFYVNSRGFLYVDIFALVIFLPILFIILRFILKKDYNDVSIENNETKNSKAL